MLKETHFYENVILPSCVLILILMEHAQRAFHKLLAANNLRLNPYFNGTCSKSEFEKYVRNLERVGLNPYFNGTCSKRS